MSSSRARGKASKEERALARREDIPVHFSDMPFFDNAYALMKERFAEEMRKIDEQMTNFGTALTQFYGKNTTVESSLMPSKEGNKTYDWNELTSSPLVEDDGNEKTLKLQFDVSQFSPEEIKLKLINDMLLVSASHEENSNGITIYKEYNREFMLPPGTDPGLVVSTLSREGVLIVQVPLPPPESNMIRITQK